MKKEVIPLYEDENEAQDIIEMTDDEGNTILMQVVDYFFYNGEEYVILTDSIDDEGDCEECHGMSMMKRAPAAATKWMRLKRSPATS